MWLGKKISLYKQEFLGAVQWKRVFLTCTVSDSSFHDFCNKIDVLFTPCTKKGLVSNEHVSLELKFLYDF